MLIKMILNGAQIVVEVLVKYGADTVFGYPGGAVLPLYDQLYNNSHRINHIITAHEQGAAHAADGFARASGKTGVVIATSGPGATNLVTGIANAYLDSVPMVAITGNVGVDLLGRDSFQEVDIVGITLPVVKHNFVVRDINELEETLNEAFFIANSGRKGPVLVDIPKSIQIDECEYFGKDFVYEAKQKSNFTIDKAIEAIKNSKKPYIYAGGGVLASNAQDELLELSKRIGAPVGFSMMGLTALASSYELNLGMCGMHGTFASNKAQTECDVMIALGVRFSDRATGNIKEYKKNCSIIHIDIDIAEIGKNIDSKINLCGDIKEVLTKLLEHLPENKNEEWLSQIKEFKNHCEISREGEFAPEEIIKTINNFVDSDTVVATDVGQHQMWTMQHYKFEKPHKLLTSGGLGTMGYGLGAAIGGCIGNNKRRTILFTSDGSFGMNLNELATAVTQELPIIIVLFNNGTLGMVRQWQKMFYDKRYCQTTLARKTDFTALAKAFGAKGFTASNIDELNYALDNINDNGPTVINCQIGIDEMVFPMIPPGGTAKNIIVRWD